MRLAERVAARDQRQRLLVIHRHIAESGPDRRGRRNRIVIAARTFGIDIDKAHLRGGQIALQRSIGVGPLMPQHLGLWAPIHHVGLPGVDASARETDGLEPHVLKRDIAGQHHQIAP